MSERTKDKTGNGSHLETASRPEKSSDVSLEKIRNDKNIRDKQKSDGAHSASGHKDYLIALRAMAGALRAIDHALRAGNENELVTILLNPNITTNMLVMVGVVEKVLVRTVTNDPSRLHLVSPRSAKVPHKCALITSFRTANPVMLKILTLALTRLICLLMTLRLPGVLKRTLWKIAF